MQQTLVDGRYVLREPSGSGGMARVYRAKDKVLGRDVALKVLRERYAEDEEFVQSFRQEARSAAGLSHPNIVSIYDLGCSEDGTYYIVMEYVSGGTLKECIVGRGALETHTAVSIALQIAGALGAAHKHGTIHRDVKPHNVLVTEKGTVKVADFGIARAVRAMPKSAAAVTRTASILGTANYMSPEQAMGEEVDPRSDLYSLGIVLYEMLTGEVPYRADTPVAIAMKHVTEPPRAPREANPEVPERTSAVVVKLLAKKPEDRYQDAAELAEDLRRIQDGLPPAFSEVPGWEGKKGADGGYMAAAAPARGPRDAQDGKRRRGKLLLPVALSAVVVLLLLLGVVGQNAVGDWEVGFGTTPKEVDRVASAAGVKPPDPIGSDSVFNDKGAVFVHRATPENISANSTYLDNPLANGNPSAVLSVTQNWNPGGGGGIYNDHPVGVWYDIDRERWAIFNQDRAPIPDGAAFNVLVSGSTSSKST